MQRLPTSFFSVLSAQALLVVWTGVVGLEVVHQFGHLVAGCSHHHHHGEAGHHHEAGLEWGGLHEADHVLAHEHMCELCDWLFSPLAGPVVQTARLGKIAWHPLRPAGMPQARKARPFWGTASGKRGPPAVT